MKKIPDFTNISEPAGRAFKKPTFDGFLMFIMGALVAGILAICILGCKKDMGKRIEFRLNKGQQCEFEIWEQKGPETNYFHTGKHNSPYSDFLPLKEGWKYTFSIQTTHGALTEVEILVDGKSKAKAQNTVTYP